MGGAYSLGDNEVWETEEKEIYKIEPQPNGGQIFVYKYGWLTELNDSISSGMTMPLDKIIEALVKGGYEVKKVDEQLTNTN